jgi:hypothetical protein
MTDHIDAMYDDRPFAADSALFSSAFKRANPPQSVMIRSDDEFLFEHPPCKVMAPREDSPVMRRWLERMDELGRQSRAFRERSETP